MTKERCSTIALADKCVLMVSDGAIVLGNMEDSNGLYFLFLPFEDVQTSAECDKQ